jgi:hypothetical protein
MFPYADITPISFYKVRKHEVRAKGPLKLRCKPSCWVHILLQQGWLTILPAWCHIYTRSHLQEVAQPCSLFPENAVRFVLQRVLHNPPIHGLRWRSSGCHKRKSFSKMRLIKLEPGYLSRYNDGMDVRGTEARF